MPNTVYILDPGLKNLLGHYFEYDRSVAAAAGRRGYDSVVLAHASAALPDGLPFTVVPAYSSDIWSRKASSDYYDQVNVKAVSAEFVKETRERLKGRTIGTGDIVFFPNTANAHFSGIAALAEELAALGASVWCMLRYPRSFFKGRETELAFRRFERLEGSGAHLCTDSARLAENIKQLTSAAIHVLPIPHTDHVGNAPQPGPVRPIHFVSLGNARGEKGLGEILDAIALTAEAPWAHRTKFTLQVNDPSDDIKGRIESYRKRPDPRVETVDRVLGTDEYFNLLKDADVVLIPYHRDIYGERTSGVFMEALTAGKVIICTRDTWMSDILRCADAGLTVDDKSARQLAEAFSATVNNIDWLRERAQSVAGTWRAIHSPDNLVSHLLGCPERSAAQLSPTRALVVFPWGDAPSGASGAARLLQLLVKYLELHYDDVRVLYTDGGGRRSSELFWPTPHTYARYMFQATWHRGLRFLIETFARLVGRKPGTSFHLWFHLWPLLDRRFQRVLNDAIDWSDDVYVEYSFFAPLAAAACRKKNKTLTVRQHDVLSDQSRGTPVIHALTRWLEFRALRESPRTFVLGERDRAKFADAGISARVLPLAIDPDADQHGLSEVELHEVLVRLCGLPLEGKRLCLFVGSSFEPNKRAAQAMREMADEIRSMPRGDDVCLVVAGRCMTPHRTGNFVSLGIVEDCILSALYAFADVVLIPVKDGTGVSIKSVESLSLGCAVISTALGMRGVDVTPGVHCVIEDDLSRFPRVIINLLENHEQLTRLRANAKAFAAKFDYRTAFSEFNARRGSVARSKMAIDLQERRRHTIAQLSTRLKSLDDPEDMEYFRRCFAPSQLEPVSQLESAASAPLQSDSGQAAPSTEAGVRVENWHPSLCLTRRPPTPS